MKTDDPKFTAHAIGELEDLTPAEIAEIEALIESDTEAAAEAAETKKLVARLRGDLQSEESEPFTAEQRAEVLAATHAHVPANPPKVVPFWRRSAVVSTIAACAIVGLFTWMLNYALQPANSVLHGTDGFSEPVAFAMMVPLDPGVTANEEPIVSKDRLSLQGSGSLTLAGASVTNSPTIDVISTTGTNSFKVAPAPVAVSINSITSGTFTGSLTPGQAARRISMPRIADGIGGMSETMRTRDGSGRSAYNYARYAKGGIVVPMPSDAEPAGEFNASRGFDFKNDAKPEPGNAASFDPITDNPFLPVNENPLSTFSTDVDTASYAIVRRFLNEQQRPPKGAVRIEELLNYFTYDYPQPVGDAPFSATMEVAACPWTPEHRLVRIGLKGREIAKDKRPASNLVFLLDVSGSMQPANRLPLLKQSLGLLIDQLGAEDRVAIVVYAGSSGCVLESTHDKAEMRLALSRLEAGGSTNGGSGIQLAYDIARKNFVKGGTNRVILGTDGDWNVGKTNQNDLFDLIVEQAKSGVFLTALGFGMGNLKDAMLVKLADKGNGNYGYIDALLEAKKLLVDQLSGTLVTIAKDVKIQVEFNPAQVSGYRLIGYEKRLLSKEDFNDDKKDAGEIGAGHTVTALYEIVPAGKGLPKNATVDPLKYQAPAAEKPEAKIQEREASGEMLTLKLRYKAPDGDTSKLQEFPLTDTGATLEKSSRDFRFAAAVASYGMLLRDSSHKGSATWDSAHELALEGKGEDRNGYRAEFISLLEKAQSLMR